MATPTPDTVPVPPRKVLEDLMFVKEGIIETIHFSKEPIIESLELQQEQQKE